MNMHKYFLAAFVAFALLANGTAFAQNNFPNRPIRILCGFGVGGGTDVVARVIGQKMADNWGESVVVDKRPGARGRKFCRQKHHPHPQSRTQNHRQNGCWR